MCWRVPFVCAQIGSTKDLHMKISDLKKGSSYNVRITARNHVGYGKPYQPDDPIVAGKRISKKINNTHSKSRRSFLNQSNCVFDLQYMTLRLRQTFSEIPLIYSYGKHRIRLSSPPKRSGMDFEREFILLAGHVHKTNLGAWEIKGFIF